MVISLLGLFILGATAYGAFWILTADEKPSVPVTGTVVSFGMTADYAGNSPIANVQLDDGSSRGVRIDSTIQEGCKIGSKIALLRTGINLEVAPGGCHARSLDSSDD